MSEALSPRELVRGLDLAEIDTSIETVKQELAALHALRKVVIARDEGTPGNESARGPAGFRSGSRMRVGRESLANEIVELLQKNGGSMRTNEIKKALGYQTMTSINRAIEDNLHLFNRSYGMLSLALTASAACPSSTEPSSTE